ncbi:MAG: aminoacetone oxidase family FAD-binding enzyme [Planctomycetota bacterium]
MPGASQKRLGKARRFLQPSVGAFPPSAVVEMFRQSGVAVKREATGKFFPVTDRAIDVRDALHNRMTASGVALCLNSSVQAIERDASGEGFHVHVQQTSPRRRAGSIGRPANKDVVTQHVAHVAGTQQNQSAMVSEKRSTHLSEPSSHSIIADAVIVTAGGCSWPKCGTTGDGYAWLQQLGHTIARPHPALVPLIGGTSATQALSGLTLPDVIASVTTPRHGSGKQDRLSRRSSLLMTHFGFSGPAAMDVSGRMTALDDISKAELRLDLVPDRTESQLREQFDRSGKTATHKINSTLRQFLPTRLADTVAQTCPATTPAELSGKGLHALITHLKRWHVPVTDTRGFDKAEVTAGGVALSEVDPKTMASRKQPGLFIAGEVLDVDGWIGGYNFQAAFSTGLAAAKGVDRWLAA